MRRRTLFGIFSHATHEVWFSVLFVILRIITGFSVLLFGMNRLQEWSVIDELSKNAFFYNWFEQVFSSSFLEGLFPWIMLICGILIILGMFIRPASFILIISHIFILLWSFNDVSSSLQTLILILCFAMFISGGAGHIIGLDYFLYSYARERTWLTKLLVG